jgi:hypothetical protein
MKTKNVATTNQRYREGDLMGFSLLEDWEDNAKLATTGWLCHSQQYSVEYSLAQIHGKSAHLSLRAPQGQGNLFATVGIASLHTNSGGGTTDNRSSQ